MHIDENVTAILRHDLTRIETALGGALGSLEEEVCWQWELGNELREAQQSVTRIAHLLGILEPSSPGPLPPQ